MLRWRRRRLIAVRVMLAVRWLSIGLLLILRLADVSLVCMWSFVRRCLLLGLVREATFELFKLFG